ncbi:MAG TPA: hypothetical protein VI750_14685 [Pyrinomonadaceae bacterium]|nr:hypothetical protein [Pyrinomonadaceae bacterium]
MAQFGRPSTDTVNESYTDQGGGSASIFAMIDEVSASDADYIQSAITPTNDVYATKLTSVTDPLVSTGHIVRYRYSKDAAGGAQIDLTVQLRQGYASEVSQGTLIASAAHTNISDTWTAGTFTLSGAEADAITNYADLFLRFVGNQV